LGRLGHYLGNLARQGCGALGHINILSEFPGKRKLKLGVETVIDVIGAGKQAGEPADEEIRALFIKDKPEDLF